MKEELQDKMVEILSSIQTATGQAKDFALEQLPEIAQSYVAFGRAWALIDLLMALIGFVFCLWAANWLRKNPWEGDFGETRGPSNSALMIVSGGGAVILFLGVTFSAKAALLVWFAPKVWLLKELAQMVH